MKATVQPNTLTDGSIVFDVLFNGEPVAHPRGQMDAENIAAHINAVAGYGCVEGLFRDESDARNANFVRMFLQTFQENVENDEEMNGGDTVDRVVEFVRALTGKDFQTNTKHIIEKLTV